MNGWFSFLSGIMEKLIPSELNNPCYLKNGKELRQPAVLLKLSGR